MEKKMNLSSYIFKKLKDKGLKIVDLAIFLNLPQGSVSTWKKRNTDPPVKYISQIALFLDISVEELLAHTSSDQPNDAIFNEYYQKLDAEQTHHVVSLMEDLTNI